MFAILKRSADKIGQIMKRVLLNLKRNSNLPGAILSILLTLSSAPAFSQTLQFSNTRAFEQENRFDMSAGILEDAFFTIDDEDV